MNKKCFCCGLTKPISEFYLHSAMKDKHLNKCKECCKKQAAEHRLENLEAIREYDRNRPNKEERMLKQKLYKQRMREENPEKYDRIFHGIRKKYRKTKHEQSYANGVVDDMLRYGKLKRPKVCSICGVSCTPQAHHPDYSKPKEIIWVCTKCHANIHKQIRAEKRKLQSQASA